MPQVRDIMSSDPTVVTPEETLQRAAQIMLDLDVGALPVCDGKQVVGMVTDRDIAVRGVAAGSATVTLKDSKTTLTVPVTASPRCR